MEGLEDHWQQAHGGGSGVARVKAPVQEGRGGAVQRSHRPVVVRQGRRVLRQAEAGAVVLRDGIGEGPAEVAADDLEVPALLEVGVRPGVGDHQDAAVPEAQDILPQHAIEEEGVVPAAHPDLVAIVKIPKLRGRVGMSGGGGAEIVLRDQLPSSPPSAVHDQLSQLGQILRPDIQAPAPPFRCRRDRSPTGCR